ncbi:MAG TPA: FAD-dependent oxidoreductase [Saprospiraceae bacterium]|nr:FAD-dependent oxidoreductase [Saprospiraceae bacterium]
MERQSIIHEVKKQDIFDIVVIGGGASGLGTALDAVSRGLSVLLVEKYDFGKGTSSWTPYAVRRPGPGNASFSFLLPFCCY